MKQLTPFKFENKVIGAITDDAGNPWFNANEVCNALGFGNARDAIARHVDADDVGKRDTIDNLGRTQLSNHVNESGMYALIFGSTKPEAKRFKRWVTSEVLPAIRKTGSYAAPGAMPSKRMQKFLQNRRLPNLDRHQNRMLNQKAASMGRQLSEVCRDYLLWELAGTAQSGGEFFPDYVDDRELQALMYFASVKDVIDFEHVREEARFRARFESIRG